MMISLDLTKSSEVRIAGDQPNYDYFACHFQNNLSRQSGPKLPLFLTIDIDH